MNINYELKIKTIKEYDYSAHMEKCYHLDFDYPFMIQGNRNRPEIVSRLEVIVTEEGEMIYSFLGRNFEFCCTHREYEINILGLDTREFVKTISKEIRKYEFEKKLGGEK